MPAESETISKPPEIALPRTIAFCDRQVLNAPIARVKIAAPWQMHDKGFPSTKNPNSRFGTGAC
jgi:hypothetical protein